MTKNAWATPRLVSPRGLIWNFKWASLPFSYGSLPPRDHYTGKNLNDASPIDLTTTFCLSRRILCVVYKAYCGQRLCRRSKNQFPADSLLRNVDKAYITTHPLQHTFGEPARFWQTRDQREPGSFLNDNGGREERPWERVWLWKCIWTEPSEIKTTSYLSRSFWFFL